MGFSVAREADRLEACSTSESPTAAAGSVTGFVNPDGAKKQRELEGHYKIIRAEARKWYGLAAAQTHGESLCALAVLLEQDYLRKNPEEDSLKPGSREALEKDDLLRRAAGACDSGAALEAYAQLLCRSKDAKAHQEGFNLCWEAIVCDVAGTGNASVIAGMCCMPGGGIAPGVVGRKDFTLGQALFERGVACNNEVARRYLPRAVRCRQAGGLSLNVPADYVESSPEWQAARDRVFRCYIKVGFGVGGCSTSHLAGAPQGFWT
jgi:TPR repeat protein